jgi:hypothetical protein
LLELFAKIALIIGATILMVYVFLLYASKENVPKKTKTRKSKKSFPNINVFIKILEQYEEKKLSENARFNRLLFRNKLIQIIAGISVAFCLTVFVAFFAIRVETKTETPQTMTEIPETPQITTDNIDNQEPLVFTPQAEPQIMPQSRDTIKKEKNNFAWGSGREGIYARVDKYGKKYYENRLENGNNQSNETPVTIKDDTILIPVVFVQNGMKVSTQMMLDTGCSGTLVDQTIIQQLQPTIVGYGTSTTADGRKINASLMKFDFLQVGPFIERNFIANTSYVQNAEQLDHQGLLGMAFLKKHPFQIDYSRQVIMWR